MQQDHKNPERVRLGRLGALTVHARGRTNVGPARAAWLAKLAAEVDPDGTLDRIELDRRVGYAMRARMTRLAMVRWGKKKTSTNGQKLVLVSGGGTHDANPPAA